MYYEKRTLPVIILCCLLFVGYAGEASSLRKYKSNTNTMLCFRATYDVPRFLYNVYEYERKLFLVS